MGAVCFYHFTFVNHVTDLFNYLFKACWAIYSYFQTLNYYWVGAISLKSAYCLNVTVRQMPKGRVENKAVPCSAKKELYVLLNFCTFK
jgi:hypothetical protein